MKTKNKFKLKQVSVVVTLFFFLASMFAFYIPKVEAQTVYTVTLLSADTGFNNLTITDSTTGNTTTFTSYPDTFTFYSGDTLNFSATAETGYRFFYFDFTFINDGNVVGTTWYTTPFTLNWVPESDINLTIAYLEAGPRTLNINSASGGYYTWGNYSTASPGTHSLPYSSGTEYLWAFPDQYYFFDYWLVDGEIYEGTVNGVYTYESYPSRLGFRTDLWMVDTHTVEAVFSGPFFTTPTPAPTATPAPSNTTYVLRIYPPSPVAGCTNVTVSNATASSTFTTFPALYNFTQGDTITVETVAADGYVFAYFDFTFIHNGNPAGTKWSVSPFTLNWYAASDINLTVVFYPTSYNYAFYGVFDETTGLETYTECTVSIYSTTSATPNVQFTLNGTYMYNSTGISISHFMFDLGTHTREYWLEPGETAANIYVFNDTLTDYTINFMDMSGLLENNQYIEAQYYVNGSLFTVEKRKVDSQNSIAMSLVNGRKYHFYIQPNDYFYGELLMTATTAVQLVIRGVDFPKETILQYRYVHAWAVRDFLNPIGAITVSFEDINGQTDSTLIEITMNETLVYNYTSTEQRFSTSWLEAENDTSYLVTVTVDHAVMGELTYTYYLRGQDSLAEPPFGLAFLGSVGLETAYFFPALLIVFVAACFSELTAEIACVLTVIVAVLLTVMGWIPIASSMLVSGMAFAILGGVVTVRRRII